jgi:hypothetical protein
MSNSENVNPQIQLPSALQGGITEKPRAQPVDAQAQGKTFGSKVYEDASVYEG